MTYIPFPLIDLHATGMNIKHLREMHQLSVRDLQTYLGFSAPQAIYKWQRGDSLPSVENLYALSRILHCTMDEIIVAHAPQEPADEHTGSGSSSVGSFFCRCTFLFYFNPFIMLLSLNRSFNAPFRKKQPYQSHAV